MSMKVAGDGVKRVPTSMKGEGSHVNESGGRETEKVPTSMKVVGEGERQRGFPRQ